MNDADIVDENIDLAEPLQNGRLDARDFRLFTEVGRDRKCLASEAANLFRDIRERVVRAGNRGHVSAMCRVSEGNRAADTF